MKTGTKRPSPLPDEREDCYVLGEENALRELDLVGAKDIASRAGVQVDTVHKWRKRGIGFPEPLAVVSDSVPVWDYREVAKWLQARDGGPWQDGVEPSNSKK